jgi:hypothetical protein
MRRWFCNEKTNFPNGETNFVMDVRVSRAGVKRVGGRASRVGNVRVKFEQIQLKSNFTSNSKSKFKFNSNLNLNSSSIQI